MRIRQVGSAVGLPDGRQNLTTFLINDNIAVDAGCLGYLSPLRLQQRVEHVFLSHSHIDHVGSLPIFLDNVYVPGPQCPSIYGNAATIQCLRNDIFNERLWPDLARISEEESPFLRIKPLIDEQPVVVDHVTITPIPVDHVVPTHGFLIEDEQTAVAFVSDSGPTERIWEIANSCEKLSAVFLECSFPNALEWLAVKTKHLSPKLFEQELQKLIRPVQLVAVHIKTGHHRLVTQELSSLSRPDLVIGGSDFEINLP